MALHIITDSGSDILQTEAAELGIEVLPLSTVFKNESLRDGVDIDHVEFFNRLIESDELPTTSQVTPHAYSEAYSKALANGDEILCITLSSVLSGCFQSAFIAQQERSHAPIYLVDSLNATLGQRLLVLHACNLRDAGKSGAEIADELELMKHRIRLVALLDTLEYLKKGGRISAAAAAAGALLSIKPAISIKNGAIEVLGKARGSKNGNNLLIKEINKTNGINFDLPYCLAYSGLDDALLKKYVKDSAHLYVGIDPDTIPVHTIGSTIGTHIGPGAIALAFFEK